MVQLAESTAVWEASQTGRKAGRGLDGLLGCAVVLMLAGGLLASCSERSSTDMQIVATPFSPPPALVPEPKPPVSPVPKSKPALLQERQVAATISVAVPPVVPMPDLVETPTPSGVQPDRMRPQSLVGMTEAETMDLLGLPVWIQETPPAKTWQYASDRCVLRVFMFMEMSTRDFRTLSYELTSTDELPNVDQQCLAELVAQAWRTGPGPDAAVGSRRPG